MRSDRIKKGINAAPQRALLHALGVTDQELGKPFIGIVSSYNEIVPGHMNLDKIVDAVKNGDHEITNPALTALLAWAAEWQNRRDRSDCRSPICLRRRQRCCADALSPRWL